jgi:hypothetical protein
VFNGNSSSPVFDEFTRRHLGADPSAQQTMLSPPPEAFAEIPREGAHA